MYAYLPHTRCPRSSICESQYLGVKVEMCGCWMRLRNNQDGRYLLRNNQDVRHLLRYNQDMPLIT